jgi:hypothetical protein
MTTYEYPCMTCSKALREHSYRQWDVCYRNWYARTHRPSSGTPRFSGFDGIPDWDEKDSKIRNLESEIERLYIVFGRKRAKLRGLCDRVEDFTYSDFRSRVFEILQEKIG